LIRIAGGDAVQGIGLAILNLVSFEKNLARLEEIVHKLESDKLDLNASLGLFEEGIELLRLAGEELNESEAKVKELIERADGVLELRDFRS
jgi:exodeoxyribonuclease VII small subunit